MFHVERGGRCGAVVEGSLRDPCWTRSPSPRGRAVVEPCSTWNGWRAARGPCGSLHASGGMRSSSPRVRVGALGLFHVERAASRAGPGGSLRASGGMRSSSPRVHVVMAARSTWNGTRGGAAVGGLGSCPLLDGLVIAARPRGRARPVPRGTGSVAVSCFACMRRGPRPACSAWNRVRADAAWRPRADAFASRPRIGARWFDAGSFHVGRDVATPRLPTMVPVQRAESVVRRVPRGTRSGDTVVDARRVAAARQHRAGRSGGSIAALHAPGGARTRGG